MKAFLFIVIAGLAASALGEEYRMRVCANREQTVLPGVTIDSKDKLDIYLDDGPSFWYLGNRQTSAVGYRKRTTIPSLRTPTPAGLPHGCLAAKVGDPKVSADFPWKFVGNKLAYTPGNTGSLCLKMWDRDYQDNSGCLDVVVRRTKETEEPEYPNPCAAKHYGATHACAGDYFFVHCSHGHPISVLRPVAYGTKCKDTTYAIILVHDH